MKMKGTAKKATQIKAEINTLGQVAVLASKQNLDMEKVMSHPLGPIPWSLATADGSPAKMNKAKLLHAIETEALLVERPDVTK